MMSKGFVLFIGRGEGVGEVFGWGLVMNEVAHNFFFSIYLFYISKELNVKIHNLKKLL